ncbi:MAG: LacI family DNA-binding transcriptional regulator [Verrucomicrobia bacterium]|nr:LacI family DNA-binding transcriptional regulator [Verrucomicrobiota bacterium]
MSSGFHLAMEGNAMTLRRIAELAGTSKSTVSRVLTNHPRISQRTREKVLAVIEEHHYRPNLFARALAGGRTGLLGVLSSNISSGFFAEVIRGLDIAASRQRGHIVVSIAHGNDDYSQLLNEMLASGQVDGLILIDPPLDLFNSPLPEKHIPLVLCASQPPDGARAWRELDSVTVDNAKAMRDLVRHLLEQGHQHIVHLAGPQNIYDAQQRRAAFEEAAKQLHVPQFDILDGHLVQTDGRETMRSRFSKPSQWPDAFVAFNDSVAFGVLAEINGAKQRIAVTGWDNSPTAEVLGMTSVEMPMTELGETSADMLLERLSNSTAAANPARRAILETTLHLRTSSKTGEL